MNSLQGASFAGLALTSWEICITFEDEIELMWRLPRRVHTVKSLYFFVRYFPLVVQVTNTIFANTLAKHFPIPAEWCRIWLTFQAFSIHTVIGAIDVILMIRIYAFYNRQKWIAVLLTTLLLARVVLTVVSIALTLPYQTFDATCLGDSLPSLVKYLFLVGELVIQGLVLGFTVVRYIMALKGGWEGSPIVALLSRDGATTFTIITAIFIVTALYAHFGFRHESAHYVFPLVMAVMSCVGCRVVISMHQLVAPIVLRRHGASYRSSQRRILSSRFGNRGEDFSTNPQLSTIIESLWTGETASTEISATTSIAMVPIRLPSRPGAVRCAGSRVEAQHSSVSQLCLDAT